eukprot:scaffold220737_cov35-Attheya_sp.AAC.1
MDRDNERYSITTSYQLEGTQLIQSWLPGIGNAGFHRYGMPDSYMSDNYFVAPVCGRLPAGTVIFTESGTFLQVRLQHFSLWQDRTPWYRMYRSPKSPDERY